VLTIVVLMYKLAPVAALRWSLALAAAVAGLGVWSALT
jgi:hypothetical protein